MGLGRLFTREVAPAEARSVQYTATDTVTGASESWLVVDGLNPNWSSATSYGVGPTVPGAWRASLLLSDLLGQVPWNAYRKLGRDLPESRIWPRPPLLEQPAPPDTRMTTISSMALDLIYHGNAIAVVAARAPGTPWPTAIVPVSATAVGVRRVSAADYGNPLPVGSIEYSVGDLRGLGPQDVIHVKGPCPPGALRGMGVLESHLATLNLAAEQGRQARSVSTHGVPTGVLKTDVPDLDDDEAADLRARWMANQSTRTVAVLNSTTSFQPLSWNPEELQLVEARKFSLTEQELIFGLPVGWLGGQTSSRTYCVDTDTEILTADGWRRYDEVAAGDLVLTLNPETSLAEWQPVQQVNVFNGPHDVVQMRSLTHSSVTTAGHRWLTFPTAGVGMVPRWRWRTTEQVNSGDRILAAAPGAAAVEAKWSDALVELVGWLWTEGHVERSGAVVLTQSEVVNPDHVARVRAALTALAGPGRDRLTRGGVGWREFRRDGMCHWRIAPATAAPLLAAAPNKVMSVAWLATLTQAQLDLLIQVSLWADGSTTNSGAQVIAQRDRARLDAFQVACALAGRSGTVRQHATGMWCMTVQRTAWRKPAAHRRYVTAGRIDGPVWCPTTGNGTWFARRDGTCYFTGNSNIEQDAVNLIKFSLSGHLARFEQAFSLAQPRGTITRAELDAVLRADTLTRYQAHAIALDKRFLTVDEVRELEHREPLPKLGETPAEAGMPTDVPMPQQAVSP